MTRALPIDTDTASDDAVAWIMALRAPHVSESYRSHSRQDDLQCLALEPAKRDPAATECNAT